MAAGSPQNKMPEDYAKSNGYADTVHFMDDGFPSGNFDRPGWKQMLSWIENGGIDMVIVKDDCVINALTPKSLENRHFLRIRAKFGAT